MTARLPIVRVNENVSLRKVLRKICCSWRERFFFSLSLSLSFFSLWQTAIILPAIDHPADRPVSSRRIDAWPSYFTASDIVPYGVFVPTPTEAFTGRRNCLDLKRSIREGERANTAESSDENSITRAITPTPIYHSRLVPVSFDSRNETKSRGLLYIGRVTIVGNYHCSPTQIAISYASLSPVADNLELNDL